MDDCIFCKIIKGEIPSKKIYEDDKVFVFMDINPICDGHLLMIPKKHYVTVFDIPKDLLAYMYEVAPKIINKTNRINQKDGCTLSFNYGYLQEVKHAHMHIMPNYREKPIKDIDEVYDILMENE